MSTTFVGALDGLTHRMKAEEEIAYGERYRLWTSWCGVVLAAEPRSNRGLHEVNCLGCVAKGALAQ